jgi:hypothetical protein
MKAKLLKLLRLTRLIVLFLGLVEKLALGLIKKLTAVAEFAGDSLTRMAQVCDE